ncbi:MAG: hypothetical protein HOQ05_08950 [Corynebacteriales bacterium]|nr:hypothetical protein [Mycobacteriales bacterium]
MPNHVLAVHNTNAQPITLTPDEQTRLRVAWQSVLRALRGESPSVLPEQALVEEALKTFGLRAFEKPDEYDATAWSSQARDVRLPPLSEDATLAAITASYLTTLGFQKVGSGQGKLTPRGRGSIAHADTDHPTDEPLLRGKVRVTDWEGEKTHLAQALKLTMRLVLGDKAESQLVTRGLSHQGAAELMTTVAPEPSRAGSTFRPRTSAAVVVVGSLGMNAVYHVKAHTGSVRTETTLAETPYAMASGKGVNMAASVNFAPHNAANEHRIMAALVAAVGDDPIGRQLKAYTEAGLGIDGTYIFTDGLTRTSRIALDPNGERRIIKDQSDKGQLTTAHIDSAREVIAKADVVLALFNVQDSDTMQRTLRHATGLRLGSLCPDDRYSAPQAEARLREMDGLVLNESEAADYLNILGHKVSQLTEAQAEDKSAVISQAASLAEKLSQYAPNIVITLGKYGAFYRSGQQTGHVDTPQGASVRDTDGAGDTFAGGLAKALVTYVRTRNWRHRDVWPADVVKNAVSEGINAATEKISMRSPHLLPPHLSPRVKTDQLIPAQHPAHPYFSKIAA